MFRGRSIVLVDCSSDVISEFMHGFYSSNKKASKLNTMLLLNMGTHFCL